MFYCPSNNLLIYLHLDEPVQSNQKDDAADIWKQPVKIDQDKTNDEQLDSYFADLLQ
jgi:hypothetical protein